jgi:hypothetical protein
MRRFMIYHPQTKKISSNISRGEKDGGMARMGIQPPYDRILSAQGNL